MAYKNGHYTYLRGECVEMKSLKVLYYFLDIKTMMFQWQRFHIVNEMACHGVDIEIFSPLDYENVEVANAELIAKIKEIDYDMFMTCLNEEHLYYETLEQIKKYGIPTVLFCPDNLVAPFNHRHIANRFDLVWLTSIETEYLFKQWGCNTIFLPYAANPNFLTPTHSSEEIKRIGFIGTPHGSRIDRINTLLDAKVPVTVHTSVQNLDNTFFKASISDYVKKLANYMRYPIGWKLAEAAIIDKLWHRDLVDRNMLLEQKDAIPLEKLAEYNGKYALILSFSDADSTGVLKKPVNIVNLRNFEVPMSGGVQFTTYSDELASYFENDKEIILCKDKEEYIEKAKFYLSDNMKETRTKIRVAARKRCEAEHTWYCRFASIFSELGIRF